MGFDLDDQGLLLGYRLANIFVITCGHLLRV